MEQKSVKVISQFPKQTWNVTKWGWCGMMDPQTAVAHLLSNAVEIPEKREYDSFDS